MTLKTTVHFNKMKSTKFLTELRARGLQITEKEAQYLMEIECERLQGFPDNWTQYGDYNGTIKSIARTQRYKLIGNAVTVDIVELIAKRLKITEP